VTTPTKITRENLSTHYLQITKPIPPFPITAKTEHFNVQPSRRQKPTMARSLYSPYGPRPRRSGVLVLLWMATFLFILFVTWYITTRHGETAREYAREFAKPGIGRLRKEVVEGE